MRSTCIIFADGAGAVIVRQDTQKRMLHFAGSMGDAAGVIHSDAPKPRALFSKQTYQPSGVHGRKRNLSLCGESHAGGH